MSNDLTFITNEENNKLVERFNVLIKYTQFFDCLVGYFYTSGFNLISNSLRNTEKIRILIGIGTDKETLDLIGESKKPIQTKLQFSSKETKEEFSYRLIEEMECSEDSLNVEKSVHEFIDWIRIKKLEIRVYPAEKIHAKLYIMTFKEGDRDRGRVITGSSNFTQSGLRGNIEFNVELKNSADHEFALNKFNDLWEKSVDVSDEYIETIKTKTWLNDEIAPHELYLKFLYEYLKEKINLDQEEVLNPFLPPGFMDLEYQKDAVRDAKAKLEEYGGVFISDVVGLGKTYISAMLAQQLEGGNLVIAPPVLLDKNNPGSWPNVFHDFGVRQTNFESLGKLDDALKIDSRRYNNVFIDEAHRFRNDSTQMYEKLFKICRGKRVILVSATPLNNTPMDILSQIKLFQNAHKSTLHNPKVRDLDKYFRSLQGRLNGMDRQRNKDEYIRIVQENADNIRKNVLHDLMVRRTRSVIQKYYGTDLSKQGLNFPDVGDPTPIYYNFDSELDKIFSKTLERIIKKFKYSRYTPLLYYEKEISRFDRMSQRNMRGFLRVLLIKRLESSFFAFNKSIGRFIKSYKGFINEYKRGNVYVSKKYINKIFEYLENNDDKAINKLIEEDKATRYSSGDFNVDFIKDLESDLKILEEIQDLWRGVKSDPKIERFIDILSSDPVLKKNKLIVFTESKETAEYLEDNLNPKFDNKVLAFSSNSKEEERTRILDNFDAKARKQKDDFRILITTDVLSEGVNLHRSNVVINYDIPWNPTKLIQRVGRVNRVDSNFKEIYTYNYFPAGPINENIGLKEAAEAKIKAFIEMLGNDSRLLTDEEIKSHDIFSILNSSKTISGEEEEEDPELKYLNILRSIRDNDKALLTKIKSLPKKARSARIYEDSEESASNSVITFLRKGKLKKIYRSVGNYAEEVDFLKAAEILMTEEGTKREKLDPEFYKYLESNKKAFENVFVNEDSVLINTSQGKSNESSLIKLIKSIRRAPEFTEEDEEYLANVQVFLKEGSVPKNTIKKIITATNNEINPLKILYAIRKNITEEFFQPIATTVSTNTKGPKEVILSEYLITSESEIKNQE